MSRSTRFTATVRGKILVCVRTGTTIPSGGAARLLISRRHSRSNLRQGALHVLSALGDHAVGLIRRVLALRFVGQDAIEHVGPEDLQTAAKVDVAAAEGHRPPAEHLLDV